MILSYATSAGRQVLMADVNPAIGGLALATMTPLAEAGQFRVPSPGPPTPPEPMSGGQAPVPDLEQPNLGPPASRLDWRNRLTGQRS
jgi:hypothetical protein